MDLQLDQLRALDAAVSEGTFEAAARRLHVTPSAISQRIRALEDAAGRILVQRTKPVRPTESGLVVLRLARQMRLLAADTARELGTTDHDAERPVLVPLAVNADSLDTWVLRALARVPAGVCSFEIHREDEDHTTRLLRDGTVMAAITSTAEAVQGCTVSRLGAMRYRPMANQQFAHTWFAEGPTAKAYGIAPVVMFDHKDELQDRLLRKRSRKPLDPPRHYIPSSSGYADAVRLGLGWGMIPDLQVAERPRARGAELVPVDRDTFIDVPLYWQQWRLESPALRAVAEAIAATAVEVLG